MEIRSIFLPVAQVDDLPAQPKYDGLYIWTMLMAILIGGLLLGL